MSITVREAVHGLMEDHGLRVVFGNPGSNELPFLKGLPPGIRYVLGLHEGVVVGMADGYSQVTGAPTFVNLHSASGTGNAMGTLTNAAITRSPLVLTAGQQTRPMVGLGAMLANVDAAHLTAPLTGFSAEPATAGDVPRTLVEAIHRSAEGPVYVSIPYDDWDAEVDDAISAQLSRRVRRRLLLPDADVDAIAGEWRAATNPVLIYGPEVDSDAGFAAGLALAEATGAPVWAAPSLPRLPFPNRHPQFAGVLPAGIGSIADLLGDHDLALVVGAPVFRYHQWVPGPFLHGGTRLIQVTSDAHAAARAPVGEAYVAEVAPVLERLGARLGASPGGGGAAAPYTVPGPAQASPRDGVLHPEEVFAALREQMPSDTRYVVESTSTNAAFWSQMDLRLPGSYFFPASGGLGFGLPAACGVALADPERPVIAVIGDGSANYALPALWTAVRENLPVTVVILRNGTYAALEWFAELLDAPGTPGNDVSGIDFVALAAGYGMVAQHVGTGEELRTALNDARGAHAPRLIEVDTERTQP